VFAVGQVFRKGDFFSGQTVVQGAGAAQVVPVSTWDDGSLKHAVVAGTVDLTANVKKTLTLARGAAPSGAVLSESQLISANPQATVSYGSYGTVNLASLLGTPALVRTEHVGPTYAAFQYIANFPNDASVRAVFYVQLWSGGKYRVRVAVENGSALTTSSAKSGNASVSIAGAQRFSGAVSMPQGVRWDAVGSNAADLAVSFDAAYLRSTKLLPNYGYTQPSATMLSSLSTSYAPMSRMRWEQDMGATGYTEGIGLLPHWDALFATTGDARALNSSVAHSRAFGSYSVFYRNNATKAVPLFSAFPTAVNGGDQEGMSGSGSNSNRWEVAHHPHAGYVAWLMTGERFHLETLQANAWAAWFTDAGSGQSGVNKIYSSQTRARAWRYRTIAAAAAVSPDGDAFKADSKANIMANLSRWQRDHVATNNPATGLAATYDDQDGAAGLQRGLFEHLFLVASVGWSWDQEMHLSASEKATLQQVRDYLYRIPVGLTGRGPSFGEFSWRRATGPYRTTVGPTSNSYYATWGQVYSATYGDSLDSTPGLTIMGTYADDSSPTAFPQSNWGHLFSALSFATDHGAPGASDGYARLTGAANWNSNAIKFNDYPQYGVARRP
jgi:hypothetical protein